MNRSYLIGFCCLCIIPAKLSVGCLTLFTFVAVSGNYQMWQSQIEIKYYSIMCFECITEFDVIYSTALPLRVRLIAMRFIDIYMRRNNIRFFIQDCHKYYYATYFECFTELCFLTLSFC